uniref:Milk-clotting protease USC3-4p n=1 Tax=Myxococcus xanthus TaxID=34 RepID=Q93SJ9_MYXXA|nr:milk-clotting protease USC3-4p [Myxococcus xanthus]
MYEAPNPYNAAIGVHHPRRLAVALGRADHFGHVVLVEPGNALASRTRTAQLLVDALHPKPAGRHRTGRGPVSRNSGLPWVEQLDVGPHSAWAQLRRQPLVVLLGGVARSIPLEQLRVRGRADSVLPDLHVDTGGGAEPQRSAGHAGRIDAGGRQVGRHHHRPGRRRRFQCGDDRTVEGRTVGGHLRGLIGDVPAGERRMRRVLLGQLRHRLRSTLCDRVGV